MQTKTNLAKPLDLLFSRTAETAETLMNPPKRPTEHEGLHYSCPADHATRFGPVGRRLEEVC